MLSLTTKSKLVCFVVLAVLLGERILLADCHYNGPPRPANPQQVFDNAHTHDKEHLREDLKSRYHGSIDTASMSDEEMDYAYFLSHDTDGSNSLDGLEILRAITHMVDEEDAAESSEKNKKAKETYTGHNPEDPDQYYAHLKKQKEANEAFEANSKLIDNLLEQYDRDNDGLISYSEYRLAQGRS